MVVIFFNYSIVGSLHQRSDCISYVAKYQSTLAAVANMDV